MMKKLEEHVVLLEVVFLSVVRTSKDSVVSYDLHLKELDFSSCNLRDEVVMEDNDECCAVRFDDERMKDEETMSDIDLMLVSHDHLQSDRDDDHRRDNHLSDHIQILQHHTQE